MLKFYVSFFFLVVMPPLVGKEAINIAFARPSVRSSVRRVHSE